MPLGAGREKEAAGRGARGGWFGSRTHGGMDASRELGGRSLSAVWAWGARQRSAACAAPEGWAGAAPAVVSGRGRGARAGVSRWLTGAGGWAIRRHLREFPGQAPTHHMPAQAPLLHSGPPLAPPHHPRLSTGGRGVVVAGRGQGSAPTCAAADRGEAYMRKRQRWAAQFKRRRLP